MDASQEGQDRESRGARDLEGVGVELRYYWDAELMQSFLFEDGTELLKEAQIKRFDLEERGWQPEGHR